jgi:hypothetical protein
MLTVGYSTRESKPEFIEYLKKSSGFKKINVIEKVNNGEKSLAQVYNEILAESTTDIVVFCHDDIYFDTPSWYHKLIKHFEKTDFGILGVAGTTDLSETGQWWVTNKRKNMVGIVNHESGGKKWESKYSDSVNNSVIPTVIIDGLFIAVSKKKLKSNFVEEFEGFHFYDLSFCLENFLKNVKVGVITNIRLTHKSIGMTNEKWENNRQKFVEKYKDSLPIKCPIDPTKRLRVLISCISFRTFTGSEVYVYELAKALLKENCSVTILSQIGGPLTDLAKKDGIKVLSFENAPGFKLGDGVWEFATPQGNQKSQLNVLYKVSEPNFDVIHVQHKPVSERILNLYPDIEKVSTIHSEVMSKELENPVEHPSIKKYIAIRPEIKQHLIESFGINENSIEVIYNPVDNEKFKVRQNKDDNYVLFVGTVDYLREWAIKDLVNYTQDNNKELWLVGANHSTYLDELLLNPHVKHFQPTWNLEKFLMNCSETAGIQLGRTTIEGWMSGKKSWIYKVDSAGTILSKELFEPPSDIEKYYSNNVAKQIRKIYVEALS